MARRLLVVFAHPDDESMGIGGTIFRHSSAGVEVHLVCATKGGDGWQGRPAGARKDQLTAIRAAELERAAAALDVASVELWDYPDGGVSACDPEEISDRIRASAGRLNPDAVITWGPDGGYGHPDHIAIGACADGALKDSGTPVYHFVVDLETAERMRSALRSRGLGDGLPTVGQPWVSVAFRLSPEEVEAKRQAVLCHLSQLGPPMDRILSDPELLAAFSATESFIEVGAAPVQEPVRLERELLPQFV